MAENYRLCHFDKIILVSFRCAIGTTKLSLLAICPIICDRFPSLGRIHTSFEGEDLEVGGLASIAADSHHLEELDHVIFPRKILVAFCFSSSRNVLGGGETAFACVQVFLGGSARIFSTTRLGFSMLTGSKVAGKEPHQKDLGKKYPCVVSQHHPNQIAGDPLGKSKYSVRVYL